MRYWMIALLLLLAACQAAPAPSATPAHALPEETPTASVADAREAAFRMNERLGRGINLGNALEAPREGQWGVTLQAHYFQLIKEQGFQSVRVPIRWSAHAQQQEPYTIDEKFFQRVDWVVEQALKNDLAVILNIHHYDEFVKDPAGQRARWLALWEQIAARYQGAPETVLFELLNEPNGAAMSARVWNELAAAGLEVVRQTNPQRFVVIGPTNWNNVDHLVSLELPEDDHRLLATFHYYNPFQFTHQGAEWNPGSDAWLGTTWDGTKTEEFAVRRDFDKAKAWSEANHRPILMGEFGAYSKADMPSRGRWTAFVAREAEARGFSWAYWEFCSGFGIYDPHLRLFFPVLVEALIPPG
jgi:endoglucanase